MDLFRLFWAAFSIWEKRTNTFLELFFRFEKKHVFGLFFNLNSKKSFWRCFSIWIQISHFGDVFQIWRIREVRMKSPVSVGFFTCPVYWENFCLYVSYGLDSKYAGKRSVWRIWENFSSNFWTIFCFSRWIWSQKLTWILMRNHIWGP